MDHVQETKHTVGSAHAASEGHHGPTIPEIKFEKSEIRAFEEEDRQAGRNIGVMLSVVFSILVMLMTVVTSWTTRHQNRDRDPQALPGQMSTEHPSH